MPASTGGRRVGRGWSGYGDDYAQPPLGEDPHGLDPPPAAAQSEDAAEPGADPQHQPFGRDAQHHAAGFVEVAERPGRRYRPAAVRAPCARPAAHPARRRADRPRPARGIAAGPRQRRHGRVAYGAAGGDEAAGTHAAGAREAGGGHDGPPPGATGPRRPGHRGGPLGARASRPGDPLRGALPGTHSSGGAPAPSALLYRAAQLAGPAVLPVDPVAQGHAHPQRGGRRVGGRRAGAAAGPST
ncbi:hypothetical protein G6F32_013734 [Rhizopus arrhizus]|nr:hypothetical protein G6F32_013734 [Rhizopus arrhizus]